MQRTHAEHGVVNDAYLLRLPVWENRAVRQNFTHREGSLP